jgi:hypothetical protein
MSFARVGPCSVLHTGKQPQGFCSRVRGGDVSGGGSWCARGVYAGVVVACGMPLVCVVRLDFSLECSFGSCCLCAFFPPVFRCVSVMTKQSKLQPEQIKGTWPWLSAVAIDYLHAEIQLHDTCFKTVPATGMHQIHIRRTTVTHRSRF